MASDFPIANGASSVVAITHGTLLGWCLNQSSSNMGISTGLDFRQLLYVMHVFCLDIACQRGIVWGVASGCQGHFLLLTLFL